MSKPKRPSPKNRAIRETERERLEALENEYWARRADEIMQKGQWLGPEESERILNEMRNAKD